MGQDVPREDDSSHDFLIQDYLENEATPIAEEEFRHLLGRESFCRRVAQFSIDQGHLCSLAEQGMLRQAFSESKKAGRRVLVGLMAGLAASVVASVIWIRAPEEHHPLTDSSAVAPITPLDQAPSRTTLQPKQLIAHVEHVVGVVVRAPTLDAADGDILAEDAELRSGQVVRTIGEDSFAVLQFLDNTILAIGGNSELACSFDSLQKRIVVPEGDLMAQVASQREESPMVIETPVAEAEILGTRLSLSTDQVTTELAVQEGEVRMQRLSDGRIVGIRRGEKLLVSEGSDLVPKPCIPVSSVWEEDFDEGLPQHWRDGRLLHESLPSGSFGAVRAVPRHLGQGDPGGPFRIATMRDWARGLFRIEPDTHLNFSYKLRFRGGFHIRLNTHADPFAPTTADTYEYRNRALRGPIRNGWRTVSVPLNHFGKTERNGKRSVLGPPPKIGDLVIMISFGTPANDPGLIIDRIWVTRGKAESAEILPRPN